MGIGFCLLARAASLDIFVHKLCKAWPPIVGGDELVGLQESWMPCHGMIVVLRDNGASEVIGGGNVHVTLVGKEIVAHLKVGQVLVVCKNLDGERGSGEVLLPCLKGVEDGKEFSVIDIIVAFSRGE